MSLFDTIHESKVYFIAEMSANHAGKLEQALELVRASKKAGADCLKIQTYTPDTMTLPCGNEYFRIKGGLWDGKTLYELYREAFTPWEWHEAIKTECERAGLDFLSTPFDKSAVDFLEELGVTAYKIASFELIDLPLIQYAASKGKPLILSCGMASPEEISDALEAVYSAGNHQVVLLKCCSEYPAKEGDMNLSVISDMKERFGVPVGFSDHSMGSMAAVVAASLGACVVEKHICISRALKSPDSEFSMEPHEFLNMVTDVRRANMIAGEKTYELSENEKTSMVFRRSVFAVRDIGEGEPFSEENIRVIRPGYGLKPKYYKSLLGISAKKAIKRGSPIQLDSMEDGVILFLTNNSISYPVYNWLLKREQVFLYHDRLTLDAVTAIRPSFIISYNYKYKIGGDIIRVMGNKIINLHSSLLPWNRGASPNFFSFFYNTPKGVTIHVLDEGIDTGDILCQGKVSFDETTETFASSYQTLHRRMQELFFENWESIRNGTQESMKQSAEGTCHTVAEWKRVKNQYPFHWDDHISEFKARYGIGGYA